MPRAFLVRKHSGSSPARKSPSPPEENNNMVTEKTSDVLMEITSNENVVSSEPSRKPGLHQPFLPDETSTSPRVAHTPSHSLHSGGQGDPCKPSNRSPTGSPSEPPTMGDLWSWWRQRAPGLPTFYPPVHQGYPYTALHNLHPSLREEYLRKAAEYQSLREQLMNATNYRESLQYDTIQSNYRYPSHVIPYGYPSIPTTQHYDPLPKVISPHSDKSQKSPVSSLFPWSFDAQNPNINNNNSSYGNITNNHVTDSTLHSPISSTTSLSPNKLSPIERFEIKSHVGLPHESPVETKRKREPEAPTRYQCEDCNKSYSTLSGLSKHKQFHCSSQITKQFACKYCDKAYVSLGALKMHIRTHTLPCKCHICGKAFSRPWLLQGHIRTHTGERPFTCTHCGRAFADRSNLRAHLQTHSDVKKYSCTTCVKTFSRMSLLLKHQDGGCVGLMPC